MDTEKERVDFEEWAGGLGYCLDRRTEEGLTHLYKDNTTFVVWDCWLASAAVDRRPPLIELPEPTPPTSD